MQLPEIFLRYRYLCCYDHLNKFHACTKKINKSKRERKPCISQHRLTEEEMKSIQDQLTMLQHMLQAKDEVIVKLTNEMFELEKNNNDPSSSSSPSSPTIRKSVVFDTDTRELEKLRVCFVVSSVFHECLFLLFSRLSKTNKVSWSMMTSFSNKGYFFHEHLNLWYCICLKFKWEHKTLCLRLIEWKTLV